MDNRNGIYQIRNLVNGKRYIGQTSRGFSSRQAEHFSALHTGKHFNIYLQRAYDKYGANAFLFEILEEVADLSLLDSREQYWIEFFDALNPQFGYNSKEAGSVGKLSKQACQKLSEACKGRVPWNKGLHGVVKNSPDVVARRTASIKATIARLTPQERRERYGHARGKPSPLQGSAKSQEFKDRLSKYASNTCYIHLGDITKRVPLESVPDFLSAGWQKGTAPHFRKAPVSAETRKLLRENRVGKHFPKISEALRGRVISPETRAKLSASNKNKKLSAETVEKLQKALTGVPKGPMSEQTKQKLREANTGRHHTDEAKERIRAASLNRSPETLQKVSAGVANWWASATPEQRANRIEQIKQGWEKRNGKYNKDS